VVGLVGDGVGEDVDRGRLPPLRRPHAVAELTRPRDVALVLRRAVGRGRAHPRRRVLVLAVAPVLPRQVLRLAVVTDDELGLRVDGVVAVGEGELEQLRFGDRLCRARLDAQVAVDAAQVVDLVDEPVALAGAHRVVDGVVLAADVDATRRTDTRAQLAADALLHPILVLVEDVTTVEAERLRALGLRVLHGDDASVVGAVEQLAERDAETVEVPPQRAPSASSWRRSCAVRRASDSSSPHTDSTTAPASAISSICPKP